MGIATKLEQGIDALLAGFITSKSQALCSALMPLALTGVTIYIILTGYLIATGRVNDSLTHFLWKALKIAFIGAIALGGGMYQSYIVEAILGIQGIFTQAFSNTPTLGGLIDNMLKPYEDLGNALWLKAFPTTGVFSLPSFSLMFAASVVSLSQFFLFSTGIGLYLLSKIALALVLSVGPFFIMCAIFPVTQKFTESWVGQALNYVFLNVLIAASISMLTSITSQFASHINATQSDANIISSTVELLLASTALVIVMLNVNQIASALCGGLSISGIGRDAFNYMAGRKQKDDDNDNKKTGQSNSNASSNNGTQPPANNTSSNSQPSSVNSISATQSGNTLEKPPIYDSVVQDQIKNGTFGKD
jgi:type IV secretion system protein VirB6